MTFYLIKTLSYLFPQEDQMEYIMEETQNHLSSMGVESPTESGDSRHIDNMKYPFMDYDILTDGPESE